MTYLIGANPTNTFPAAQVPDGRAFGLGDRFTGFDGREYVYIGCAGAVAANDVVYFDTAYAGATLSTANDARGNLCGVAPVAFAAGDQGWVQVKGPISVNVLANAAANTRLNTTATAGKLDDDGTATTMQVQGIYLTAANGASTAATAAVLNYPFVDATL